MATPLNWHQAVALCEQRGEPYALVTVLGVTGSVPREPATKMVITGEHCYDTIGGGHLEHRICQQARERLARRDYTPELAHFPLGASLGQCCGGRVSVLLEAHPGCQQQLVLFGAGHVAKAVVQILAGLPWR
ncbi:MAG TPA: xanthine dehydrogenase accessory protein XdhC, partial [Marinobacter hydrocarbonoclasticus]|nr:xanthine dehydrogenase accessory protein XdhC [Marinobacter nauticus]